MMPHNIYYNPKKKCLFKIFKIYEKVRNITIYFYKNPAHNKIIYKNIEEFTYSLLLNIYSLGC